MPTVATDDRPVEDIATCSRTLYPVSCRKCCTLSQNEFFECYLNCVKKEAKKFIDSIKFEKKN